MKEHTDKLRTVFQRTKHLVRMAGILRWDARAKRDDFSDLDVFVLMPGGRPSDYLRLCAELCREISEVLPDHFIFASFRQQMLLANLVYKKQTSPLHYLQYLGTRHLIIREVNTLPRFLPQSLHPLLGTTRPVLQEIQQAYSDRASLLHPSATRFYYYFDILNETLALFGNRADVIPEPIVIQESLHKLRFTAKCLALEIVSPNLAPESNVLKTFGQVDALLRSLGYGQLTQLREEIRKCSQPKSSVSRSRVAELFGLAYSVFDMIEPITEPTKEKH